MPAVIGYDDFCVHGLLSGGSWLATLPLENVQTDDVREVAQSTNALPSSTTINVDLGVNKPVGMIVIGPTNLTEGLATYRLRSFSDAAMTQMLYDTGTITLSGTSIDWNDPNAWLDWENADFWSGIVATDAGDLPLYVIITVPTAQIVNTNAQFFKIELRDSDNVDGHIDVGRLCFFRSHRPAFNYQADNNELGIDWLIDVSESLGGRREYWQRGSRRHQRMSWKVLPQTELFTDWFNIASRSGLNRQVCVVPEESDNEVVMRKRAFLSTFKASPAIVQAAAGWGSTSIDLEEVI